VEKFLEQPYWTQQRLAEKAHVSLDSIGRLLAGQNMDRAKVWDKVARAMGTTCEKLELFS
jgi:prophage regulatory protein